MKRVKRLGLPILAIALIAALLSVPFWHGARAATPVTGAAPAKAGTGGVTKGLFVTLESAGTIITATAVTDPVVGVCEATASANGLTRYAPAGTMTTVTSGEQIAVGNLLTAGTGGKAFVLDTDDASTQRVAAMALTAAGAADVDVTCIVLPSVAEQRLTLGGNVTISGAATLTTGTGTTTISGAATIAGAATLSDDVTVAAGKDISFAAGAGYLELNGTTSGGITVDPIDVGTSMTTIVNSAAAAATTVTLPAVTGQLNWQPGGTTTSAADSLAIPITHAIVVKTTGADAEALTLANGKPGQVLTIVLGTDGGGDGTLTPTTKTGFATIVFADAGDTVTLLYVDDTVGWIIMGTAGVTAPPVISV